MTTFETFFNNGGLKISITMMETVCCYKISHVCEWYVGEITVLVKKLSSTSIFNMSVMNSVTNISSFSRPSC